MTVKNRGRQIILCAIAVVLAGCSGFGTQHEEIGTTSDGTSKADSVDEYKVALAQRVVQVNSTNVFVGRPQALLRSVVVIKYSVDANGGLIRSEILRSNRDRATESTAPTARCGSSRPS